MPAPTVLHPALVQEGWLHGLERLPSLFGRLLYLSSLRDHRTRRYYQHDLARALGRDGADRVIREAHLAQFQRYVSLGPQELKADLERYLSRLDACTRTLLAVWSSQVPCSTLMPDGADRLERTLFLAGARAAAVLLRRELEGQGCEDEPTLRFLRSAAPGQPLSWGGPTGPRPTPCRPHTSG